MSGTDLWDMLLRQTIQVSLLAVVVWGLAIVFATDRPHLAHALWAIVLLKCVTPPIIASPASPFCWLESVIATNQVAESAVERTPHPTTGPKIEPSLDHLIVRSSASLTPVPERNASMSRDRMETAGAVAANNSPSLIKQVVLRTWLAGTVLGILWTLMRVFRFLSHVRQLITQTPAVVDATVATLTSRLGLRRAVTIRVIDAAIGPAVVGVFRPTMLLPRSIIHGKTQADLEPLLAHELIHIRRGDLWWALLQTLATRLWWFHPIVWMAGRMLNREAERSCDEETLASIGCHPAAYARSLLDVLERKHQLHVAPALPGVRPVEITAKKMERIMRLGQGCHRRSPWWVAVLLLIGSTIALPGAAWVLGREATRASDKSSVHAATVEERQPGSTGKEFMSQVRPWRPSSNHGTNKEAFKDAEKLFLEKLPVGDLIPKICTQLRIERPEAERMLAISLRPFPQAVAEPTTAKAVSIEFVADKYGLCQLGGDEPPAKVVGDDLYVFGDAKLRDAMKRSLEFIREFGVHQIAVAIRFVTVPAEMMESMDIEWNIVSPESPPDNGVALPYEESLSPTLVSILDGEHAAEFIESIQNHTRANTWQAPRITLFNGQEAFVQDGSERPFVVSCAEIKGELANAYQPVVRVVTEGNKVVVRPVLSGDQKSVNLTCSLQHTDLVEVDELAFKRPGKAKGETITVQVPNVRSQVLKVEQLNLACGSTLLLSGIPTEDCGHKMVIMAIVNVELLDGMAKNILTAD